MSTDERRAAFIAALRKLADAMERHENIPLPYAPAFSFISLGAEETPEGIAGVVRDLGATHWRQEPSSTTSGITFMHLTGDLGGGISVRVQAREERVTDSVQTGVAPVYERKNAALDAVIAEAQEGGQS
jgi:hypothetical protein